MREQLLVGLKILLVEDAPIIALDVEDALVEAGATVIGPFGCLEKAMKAAAEESYDLAVLDVDLGREEVFPAADIVARRGIPFLFYTGRPDRATIRERFAQAPVCAKPSPQGRMVQTLEGLLKQAA